MNYNIRTTGRQLMKLLAAALFVTLGASVGFSQGTISTTLFYLPNDTVVQGSTDTATVIVKNIDNAVYSGYINVYYSTDTVTFSPLLLCTLPNVTLNAGDSITSSCTITFDSTYFYIGKRIIVVWSSGNGKMAADSLWDSVYVTPQIAGVHENDLNSSFRISPNPAKDNIRIKMNGSALRKEMPEQIKISDMLGRTVQTEAFSGKEEQRINVQHLPPGLYFLELLYNDNKKGVQKFVRSD